MEYKILRLNNDNTAHVELGYKGKLLNQDISLGTSHDEFESNIKQALKVLGDELTKPQLERTPVDYGAAIGEVKKIKLN